MKYVWNRNAGFAASKPDMPPSPPTVCGQTTEEPLVSNVPLSCVPPCTFFEFAGFTDRCWNCSVCRPLFMFVYAPGTAESSDLHCGSCAAVRWRESHRADVSTRVPSDRIRPPSEPSMNWSGLPGMVTSACWSGCRPFGVVGDVASCVRSVQCSPPSRESSTARAFERPLPQGEHEPRSSGYVYEPIT